MRRLLPLALLLAGCGGDHHNSPAVDYPALGADSMDLAISGAPSGTATSMRGTGAARGSMVIVTPTGDGVAIIEVRAALQATKVTNGTRLTQTLTLGLNDPTRLAVGATFTIDGTTNTAQYEEIRTYVGGGFNGDSFGKLWKAQGGTATVVSYADGVATLRLSGVGFLFQGVPDPASYPAIAFDGTVSGRVVAALDMG